MFKRCSRCKKEKPKGAFLERKDRPGQCQPHCKDCDKFRTREARKRVRTTLIAYYSNGENFCAKCGESNFAVLDLDHTNGGGIKDRQTHKTIHQYYMRLIRDNFPEGYRVLCRNCNWLAWIARKDKKCQTKAITGGVHTKPGP